MLRVSPFTHKYVLQKCRMLENVSFVIFTDPPVPSGLIYGVVAAAVVAAVILVVLIILTIICCWQKRKDKVVFLKVSKG